MPGRRRPGWRPASGGPQGSNNGTAEARQVCEETILPRITACFAERGGRLAAPQTVSTPLAPGCDFVGQTLWKHTRRHGTRAKLQRTPSTASLYAITTKVKTRCTPAAGATRDHLSATLTPVVRGWANSHRHGIWRELFATRDRFGWRRLSRWATRRHLNTTGRGLAARSFSHRPGETWRFPDPTTGNQLIRVQEALTQPRSMQIKGDAHPCAPHWEAYCHYRERQLVLTAPSAFRAKVRRQQPGRCPRCQQMLQDAESLALHDQDGNHQNNRRVTLVL